MENNFYQLALVLSLASALGFIVFKLRLPLIVAYLSAGVILSISGLAGDSHSVVLHVLPEMGVAFVLFLIGMELDLREIKALGLPIIVSAVGQIVLSTIVGTFIASLLGFPLTESVYLGLALAFSSTVVVVKILLEKSSLASLSGKLAIGILLVEDLIAILVLMFISLSSSVGSFSIETIAPIGFVVLKALGLFFLTFVLSNYVLRGIFDRIASSVELLFFTAVTWCFVFTAVSLLSGFNIEIGAFLAGVALASSPYHFQIQGKIKPLRDFFLIMFFIYLGSQVQIHDLWHELPIIVVFTLCALLLKPIIYLLLLGIFGFRKHTLFQTALSLSQISEFSLIVLVVGVKAGVVSQLSLSIMASVAVITISLSSILIASSRKLYKFCTPFVRFFEHSKKTHFFESQLENELEDHVVVIGAHRIGSPIIEYLKKSDVKFVVMDINPHLIKKLQDEGVNAIYGDVSDPEILTNLQLEKAQLIISTASYISDNEILLEECSRRKTKASIIVRAEDKDQAEILKAMGASFIIMPEKVSGEYLVDKIKRHLSISHEKHI